MNKKNNGTVSTRADRRSSCQYRRLFRPAHVPRSSGAWVGRQAPPLFLRPDDCGFVLVWWALLLGLVAVPLLAVATDGLRYLKAAGDVQIAADAAAEAAVREVDIPYFVETGLIRFSGNESALAFDYANANAAFLQTNQITVEIVAIEVDDSNRTVQVTARADVSRFLPRFAPQILIERTGLAQVQLNAQ